MLSCCCSTAKKIKQDTSLAGLPFFLVQTYQIGKTIPNKHKLNQMDIHYPKWTYICTKWTYITYTKWHENIPNGHKIYQHFPFQGPPKFTQIRILGLRIKHLATLLIRKTVLHHRIPMPTTL
jgi:hypothetical protein